MSDTGISGQVLGASTSIAAGVSTLPYTGENVIGKILSVGAIAAGIIVILSLVVSILIKKALK